ncbi:MAG: phage/plasmid primase, P4 family, partial [Dehalococcoidales bacterium]|nr:phage/plasmid primase, P4 family [Dehalococcoidales bacterium]
TKDYKLTVSHITASCNGSLEEGLKFADVLFNKAVFPYTDLGNAERLYFKFGDCFRWVTERQRFIIWTGHVWEYDTPDHTGMLKLAKATVRDIVKEPDGPGDKGYENKIKHALSSESGKRQREMLNLVKAEGDITISINDLDKDIYLFNCQNATIDLRTGQARAQNKEDLITIMAPVDYDPAAGCPRWEEFLNLIQNNSQAMIVYLQKISGYCLTGDTKTDIIPFCHGMGGNGKSTYWAVIRDKVMGSYGYEVDPDVFLVNNQKFKDSGQREELANLYGKRLVTATEIPEGRQLTTSLLKAISGGESIHGDRKYERGVTFKPTFKVILSGNNEPVIKDNTDGSWRRLKKIPFTVKIQNQIDGFEDTFNDELPGILNWLIAGCLLWQREGLKDPQEVIEATAEYRKDQDLIAQFLEDCCIRTPDAEVTKKDFKAAYQKWCTESSIKAMSDKELKQRLQVFGIKDGFNSTKTARVWTGVRLRDLTDSTDSTGQEIPKSPHEGENLRTSKENAVRSCPWEANYGQDSGPDDNFSAVPPDNPDKPESCKPPCNLCPWWGKMPDGKFDCTNPEVHQ